MKARIVPKLFATALLTTWLSVYSLAERNKNLQIIYKQISSSVPSKPKSLDELLKSGEIEIMGAEIIGDGQEKRYEEPSRTIERKKVKSLVPGQIEYNQFYPNSEMLVVVFKDLHPSKLCRESIKEGIRTIDKRFKLDCIGFEGYDQELRAEEWQTGYKKFLDSLKQEWFGIGKPRSDSVYMFGIDDRLLLDKNRGGIAYALEAVIKFVQNETSFYNHMFRYQNACRICIDDLGKNVKGADSESRYIDRRFARFLERMKYDDVLFKAFYQKATHLLSYNSRTRSLYQCYAEFCDRYKRFVDKKMILDDRDRIFIKKATETMQEKDFQFGVLIAGGSHAKGMKELLDAAKTSYVFIRPKGYDGALSDKEKSSFYNSLFGNEVYSALQLFSYVHNLGNLKKVETPNPFLEMHKRIFSRK